MTPTPHHSPVPCRRFLFLQGPHGPFFAELSAALRMAGHDTLRVGFNRGDRFYWPDMARYRAYQGLPGDWAGWLADLVAEAGITDLVMYGDTRPIHHQAKAVAADLGLVVHCFEEGYLRPYWITYERGGANGHSPLMQMPLSDIAARVQDPEAIPADAPATWGSLWHHVFYGCIYHANILFRNRDYPRFRTHRDVSVFREWRLHCRRLALIPAHALWRKWATRRLLRSGRPFHVGLLQLGHDASMRDHSPLGTMGEFIELVIAGFAEGAPPHHILAFKAHPLEDGREPIAAIIRAAADKAGVGDRVHFIPGGKLGPLLDRANSAITVNSTAGQQVLWRGLPLKTFGAAISGKPEFVSAQPIAAFFSAPVAPDLGLYRLFRQFLLETSQISGGFYTARARAGALRRCVDAMLAPGDPYECRDAQQHNHNDQNATLLPKFSVVKG